MEKLRKKNGCFFGVHKIFLSPCTLSPIIACLITLNSPLIHSHTHLFQFISSQALCVTLIQISKWYLFRSIMRAFLWIISFMHILENFRRFLTTRSVKLNSNQTLAVWSHRLHKLSSLYWTWRLCPSDAELLKSDLTFKAFPQALL